MSDSTTPEEILKKHWGFDRFRDGQLNIIQSVISGNDTLALLPTGGGKSICFQVPGLLLGGLTLVVSPLIALMKDQVDGLKQRNISANFIHSALAWKEIKGIMENALKGHYSFLYVSPERLLSQNFTEYLPNLNIKLLVVDEAHCISSWGSDFRPSFKEIYKVREFLSSKTPVAAFTASAPDWIQEDIISGLQLKNHKKFQGEFGRNNLVFQALYAENKRDLLLHALKHTTGCSIVFGSTRKEVQDCAQWLAEEGISSHFYHGGLPSEERSKKQTEWMQNKVRVMVCTNAFGMGVDKPDVRYVFHLSPSATPEDYYQEAGRAGRDGNKSFCILFYNSSDWLKSKEFIAQQHPPIETLKQCYHAVMNALGIAPGNGQDSVNAIDWTLIAEKYKISVSQMFFSIKIIEKLKLWHLSEGFNSPSKIKIQMDYSEVYDFKIRYEKFDSLLDVLMRGFGGIFEHFTTVIEPQLARKALLTEDELTNQLGVLQKAGVIDYIPRSNLPMLTLLEPRSMYPSFDMKTVEALKKRRIEALEKMQEYSQNKACRSNFWVNYFTGEPSGNCFTCDNCKKKFAKPQPSRIQKEILERLSKPSDFFEFTQNFPLEFRDNFLEQLNKLMDAGKIQKSADNQLSLQA
jgi:ATP-dependent DNA helicase RecQ